MLTTTNVATPPATINIVVEERVDAISHGNMRTWNGECVLLLRNICVTRFKRTFATTSARSANGNKKRPTGIRIWRKKFRGKCNGRKLN